MKKVFLFCFLFIVLTFSACSTKSSENIQSEPQKVTVIGAQKDNDLPDTEINKEHIEETSKTVSSETISEGVKRQDTVFATPKGRRYHFDKKCGGENSNEISLNEALNRGLTPCKKCAGG